MAKQAAAQASQDLAAEVAAKQADLLGYKKGLATGELKNPAVIRATRKEIARLKTAMNSKSKEGDK